VSLAWGGELTYAYPEPVRTRGLATWSVTASPDGALRDSAGRTYPSLFWEGTSSPAFTQAEGFVVEPGGETVFLEEKLALLGLSERESADFITYWGPRMRTRGRCLVTFATDQYARRARYTFVGNGAAMVPDTFVRVYVVIGAVPREGVPAPRADDDAAYGYARFADDIVICSPHEPDLLEALELLDTLLTPRGLRLHQEKTTMTSFDEGFCYLGTDFSRSFPPVDPRHAIKGRPDPDQAPHHFSGAHHQTHPRSPPGDLTHQSRQRGPASTIPGRRTGQRHHRGHRTRRDNGLQPLPLIDEDVGGLRPADHAVDGNTTASAQVDESAYRASQTVDDLDGGVLGLRELGTLRHQVRTALSIEAALQVGNHHVPVHEPTSPQSARRGKYSGAVQSALRRLRSPLPRLKATTYHITTIDIITL